MSGKTYKIAVIPGDGIGKEVMPEGIRVMDAAAKKFNISLEWQWFDFASAEYWQQHGKMLPDDWFATLSQFDAIYFGAVGWPDVVPDHVSLWGSLLLPPHLLEEVCLSVTWSASTPVTYVGIPHCS